MTPNASTSPRAVAATGPWRIRLLGTMSASCGDEHLTQFGSRSVVLLLARLSLHPARLHAREELIELLWPGVAIEAGRNRLRQTLFGLRQILEPPQPSAMPVLAADRFGIRVIPGRLEVDVARFEATLRERRAGDALALYAGELLPGFYDDWVVEDRHRLSALAERAESLLAADDAASGRLATRQPVAPLRVVASGASTAELVDRDRRRLPLYLTRFFGRDQERAALASEMRAARLVTLQGAGGSGKTRLAIELASTFAERGKGDAADRTAADFDVVAFAPLVGCTTEPQMLAALIAALGLRLADGTPFDALVAGLEGRRALLVLDNFEQLVEAGALLVARLTATLPDLHLLVTSRRALGVDGERVFVIESLELPPRDTPPLDAAAIPAVALFVDRARAARADFAVRAQVPAIVDLVRLLEGMPLAIELAAARVRSMTPAQMALLLCPSGNVAAPAALALLARSGPRAGTDPRHASMQAVIDWSWRLLAPPEAALLAASTVFQGGFTAAAAAAVCVDGDAAGVPLVIDALVGHSLLRATLFDAESTRYASLEPVREFAASQLATGDAARLRQRHREWCAAWAESLPATPVLAEVRAELPNIAAALASAVADDAAEAAIRLGLPMRRVLETVELPADALDSLATAVDRCREPVLQAWGRVLLGPLLFIAGRSDAALACAGQALDDALPGSPWRGRALYALARVSWRRRRTADAAVVHWVDEAASLAESGADLELQADVFALRGFIANGQRDPAAGEALYRQALWRWEQLGNRHAVNSGRYSLAVCAQEAGRHREALEQLAAIEPVARDLHDWRRVAQLLNVRGNALSELRAWPEAVAALRESAVLAWDCMAAHELAYAAWNLPRALAHVRQPEAAVRLAAFASTFWQARFGALTPADAHDLRRVQRLCARQLGAARIASLRAEGGALTPAAAVASLVALAG